MLLCFVVAVEEKLQQNNVKEDFCRTTRLQKRPLRIEDAGSVVGRKKKGDQFAMKLLDDEKHVVFPCDDASD